MHRRWCWWVLNVEVCKFTHTIVLAKCSSKLQDLWTYVQSTAYSEIVKRKGMTKHSCEIQTEIWNKEFRNLLHNAFRDSSGINTAGAYFWPLALLKLRMSEAIPLLLLQDFLARKRIGLMIILKCRFKRRYASEVCLRRTEGPASWSGGQSFLLLITRSRVRFPVLPWGFSLFGEDPRGDHGLGS